MAINTKGLNPSQVDWFSEAQNNALLAQSQANAQTQYNEGQASLQNKWANQGITDQYNQFRTKLSDPFVSRGTLDSGIYNKALAQYATNRANAFNQQNLKYAGQDQGYALQTAQTNQSYANTNQSLQNQETNLQKTTASQISGV